jgi:hypothetical protein
MVSRWSLKTGVSIFVVLTPSQCFASMVEFRGDLQLMKEKTEELAELIQGTA